ncbi:glycosyltransferase family 4 protein [Gaetbulibacter sp. M240]|uniref:glycosyltransferase family 4 protein n=1 Tax=Gaetbulibacter sp. M240 TaxID=3126511 RepID=UPI00374E394B
MYNILIVGPLPEPTTGVSLANKVVFEGLTRMDNFSVDVINTSYNKFDENLGVFSFSKAFFYLKINFYAFKILNVDKVYITPGQTFFGVLKYGLFIVLSRLFGKELIIHVHGNYLGKEFAQVKGLKKRILRYFLKMTSKGIVLSESLKGNMAPFVGNDQIFVLYNFVEDYLFLKDENQVPLNGGSGKVKIIFLSNLMEEKGIFDLLEALTNLEEEGFDFKAKIAGNIDSKHSEKLSNYFDKLKNTEYCGVVSGKAKKDLLFWGNIFVLPTYYEMEGQPISILEAMATENLILTTEHAGIPDIFKDRVNGYYVDKKSPKSIVDKIKLSSDPIISQSIREYNGSIANKKYKQDHFIGSFIQIVES